MSSDFETNLRDTDNLLERFRQQPLPHFIDGKHDDGRSGITFENLTPIDNSVIGNIAAGNADDIDAACKAAEAAFEEWRDLPGKERKKVLHKVADGIEARARDIALVESYDSGQALRFMSKAAVRGAANFRFFGDLAPSARDGQALPADEHLNYSIRQPIGPVGVITPWNTPFMLSTWKIAPALAAGCTVVHKPAEWSPYTAMMLSEIAHDAGLPDGVLNCVQGLGEDAGKPLTEHPAIKAVAFVGESLTGSHIMRQGADTLKRVHGDHSAGLCTTVHPAAVRGAANFRFFGDLAPSARDGQALPADEHLNYSIRQPIGPVGVITPWNTPFMLSTWKIAPALAAGCTVVHAPRAIPTTTLTAFYRRQT